MQPAAGKRDRMITKGPESQRRPRQFIDCCFGEVIASSSMCCDGSVLRAVSGASSIEGRTRDYLEGRERGLSQ